MAPIWLEYFVLRTWLSISPSQGTLDDCKTNFHIYKILVLLFLPETKGISLEKMDSIFGAVDYGQNNDRIDGEKLGKDSMDLKKAPVEVEIVPATNSDAVTPVASRKMHEDLETHKV